MPQLKITSQCMSAMVNEDTWLPTLYKDLAVRPLHLEAQLRLDYHIP